jgi:L-lactate dehydrogenase (cytochrome)
MSMNQTDVQAPIKETGDKAAGRGSASPLGVSQAISGYQDTNLTWSDIDFIRVSPLFLSVHRDDTRVFTEMTLIIQKHTPLPLVVKGVQCVEDIELCAKAGVDGVIISNHGGRQLD